MAAGVDVLHDEVLEVLRAAAAGAEVGERIRVDRGSSLEHLGLRTPVRRRLVKAGFSFSDRGEDEILAVWDGIWRTTAYADVMFAALDHYRERLKTDVPTGFWPVAAGWIDRVDNWALADDLARVYSWALAARGDEVYPSLVAWNRSDEEWRRRISIVSLIHYSGKGAVFLPPERVVPLVERCLSDHRATIQKAVGWVVREMLTTHPDEMIRFIEEHRSDFSAVALRRATERLDPSVRSALMAGES